MKHVLIIGGGVAGLEASNILSGFGYRVSIVEQTDKLGGKLNQWNNLIPDNQLARELLQKIQRNFSDSIQLHLSSTVFSVKKFQESYELIISSGKELKVDAILICTGFDLFNSKKKEEYGYLIYENVITSADLEECWRHGKKMNTSHGKTPKRIGMIHCVGSRDEKIGNTYCSKVCCITAIKQSMEIREKLPESEVFCFYMDLQLFGKHFADLYKKAQCKYGVQFIRGRLSECFENSDGSVLLKVEDTLLGKPLRMNVDMVVLMAGMVPNVSSKTINQLFGLETTPDGFLRTVDPNYDVVSTNIPGVFTAGACTGPKTIEQTINEARSAAVRIHSFFNN